MTGFDVGLTARLQFCHLARIAGGLAILSLTVSAGNALKILLVEDEPKTGSYLRQGLREAGFNVDLVTNGRDGLHMALETDYDLAILDVMLPSLDGWQILSMLRRAGKAMPVLFLSARDQVEDRVKGLELGADDYLIKPFSFSELLARVRTLLRRGQAAPEATFLRAADRWCLSPAESQSASPDDRRSSTFRVIYVTRHEQARVVDFRVSRPGGAANGWITAIC